MYLLKELLIKTIELKASDLHLTVGLAPTVRCNGKLINIHDEKLTKGHMEGYARELLGDKYNEYMNEGEYDIAYSIEDIGRFRVNVFRQQNNDAVAIRVISFNIPTLDELNYPPVIKEIVKKKSGLILVTGPTGSGKSTTLAAMINEINNTRQGHIITLEDPIEYKHNHNNCIVNQREIGRDSKSYKSALKAVLREDPDVILIGEMRDIESISIAITAAETGHLVFSSLHTIGAAKTIDRILDAFPPHHQQQIKFQLSTVLQGVISQQLLPTKDESSRIAALEIMVSTAGIENLIREGKSNQLESALQTGSKYGMRTMDISIAQLYKEGIISFETAIAYAVDKENVKNMMNL